MSTSMVEVSDIRNAVKEESWDVVVGNWMMEQRQRGAGANMNDMTSAVLCDKGVVGGTEGESLEDHEAYGRRRRRCWTMRE